MKATRPLLEERKVEAVQVVLLDHVGVGVGDRQGEAPDQVRLRGPALAAGLDRPHAPVGVAHGDEEDPVAGRVEPRRLEVELHPLQPIEREVAEVAPPGRT